MNWYTHNTKAVTKKNMYIYIYLFPENMHVLEKIVVGRLFCFRNDPFLGDMCVLVCVVLNFRDLINMKHFFEASASAGWHSTVHRSCMENHLNFNKGRNKSIGVSLDPHGKPSRKHGFHGEKHVWEINHAKEVSGSK